VGGRSSCDNTATSDKAELGNYLKEQIEYILEKAKNDNKKRGGKHSREPSNALRDYRLGILYNSSASENRQFTGFRKNFAVSPPIQHDILCLKRISLL
jgi:hypothetical protein